MPGDARRALAERVYIYRALSWLWHLARGEPADGSRGGLANGGVRPAN